MNKLQVTTDPQGDLIACAKGFDPAQCGWKPGSKVCGKCGATPKVEQTATTDTDEPDIKSVDAPLLEEKAIDSGTKPMGHVDPPAGDHHRVDDDSQPLTYEKFKKRRARMLAARSGKAALDDTETKDATGAFLPEFDEVASFADEAIEGKVYAVGHSTEFDHYIAHVQRKSDGQWLEMHFTDEGELDGWFRIPEEEVLGKSAVISVEDAIKVAQGVIQGKAVGYSVAEFEGMEAYRIQIETTDAKSYDVFVAPSGEALGHNEYTTDYAASIAGKAGYDDAEMLVKSGAALADGTFPILDFDDVINAIAVADFAADPAATKAHIAQRAAALDCAELVPSVWAEAAVDVKDAEVLVDAEKTAEDPEINAAFEAALMEMQMLALETDLGGL